MSKTSETLDSLLIGKYGRLKQGAKIQYIGTNLCLPCAYSRHYIKVVKPSHPWLEDEFNMNKPTYDLCMANYNKNKISQQLISYDHELSIDVNITLIGSPCLWWSVEQIL